MRVYVEDVARHVGEERDPAQHPDGARQRRGGGAALRHQNHFATAAPIHTAASPAIAEPATFAAAST